MSFRELTKLWILSIDLNDRVGVCRSDLIGGIFALKIPVPFHNETQRSTKSRQLWNRLGCVSAFYGLRPSEVVCGSACLHATGTMMMTRLVIRTMWLVTILMVGFAQGFQRLGLVHRCNLLSASSLGSSRLHQSTVLDMDKIMDTRGMQFSGLQGKALVPREYPTLGEVKAAMPADVFVKSTTQSLSYAAMDLCTTGLWMTLGVKYMLPTAFSLFSTGFALNQIAAILLLAFYSIVGGTFGIGMWVTAHECGHGAFSDNRRLQDFVGYLYHSLWLVPYFSWQRSHAVHHANTNHIIDGETHVPPIVVEEVHVSDKKKVQRTFGDFVGESLFGTLQVLTHLFVGWPAYLLLGVTGGPSRGFTNHFLPVQFPRSPNQQSKFTDNTNTKRCRCTLFGLITLAPQLLFNESSFTRHT